MDTDFRLWFGNGEPELATDLAGVRCTSLEFGDKGLVLGTSLEIARDKVAEILGVYREVRAV